MSQVSRGISLVFYFLLYFMNFSLKSSSSSRFSFRIVRKTKVEKLQSIDEGKFYGIVSSQTEMREKAIYGGKLERGAIYEVKVPKRGRKSFWKRNKVVPVVPVREEAWTNSSVNKTADKDSAGSHSQWWASAVRTREDGKMTIKRSLKQWNTKTGNEIKTEEKQNQASCSSGSYLDMFLNDLTPTCVDNFDTCQSNGLPCEPFFVEEDPEDVPSVSDGFISHVTLNLKGGEAWGEGVKLTDKKSALNKFLSRFHKRVKTTKVKKIRI